MVVDLHGHLVAANAAVDLLAAAVGPATAGSTRQRPAPQLAPRGHGFPHPQLPEWRAHLLDRLHPARRPARAPSRRGHRHPALRGLHGELSAYPGDTDEPQPTTDEPRYRRSPHHRHGDQDLSLISTTTVFGAPKDVTLAGLAIETFFPADERTAELLRALS
ncbi:hypothetical protein EIL87_18365 [Saccharopolyspora rhizosphaerae]|uniref:MmyB-like transcription regulator ligand binding domain-containing protein n=1 Tax=Saccharopolyspora rhizosphaerae TaxID=2492662 RepID=A0A3R8QZQ1_9PSEU|nr:hypothetical protein EIL87_18365 [Saccharopolyspora rhizosphaerae]